MPEVDRRRFLQVTGGERGPVRAHPVDRARGVDPGVPARRVARRRRARRRPDAGEPLLRPLLRHHARRPRVRRPAPRHPAQRQARSGGSRTAKKEVLPFRPDLEDLGLAFLQDLDHGWDSRARRRSPAATTTAGCRPRAPPPRWRTCGAPTSRSTTPWPTRSPSATPTTAACSARPNPNRYYLWTGWVGNDGKGGGPVIGNDELAGVRLDDLPRAAAEGGRELEGLPGRRRRAGRRARLGLEPARRPTSATTATTPCSTSTNYQNATPGGPLFDRARTGTDVDDPAPSSGFFDQLTDDVTGGTLPQVSWIVAPEAFTEHPNWPANYGAWYVSKVLDALTSDPDVWAKTALFLTFDENDGFFDHVVPPYPNVGGLHGDSTVAARPRAVPRPGRRRTGPYGLGVRVPMTVSRPGAPAAGCAPRRSTTPRSSGSSRSGSACASPNITPWRRAVCGDLTSAFDFSTSPGAPCPRCPNTDAVRAPGRGRSPAVLPRPCR